MFKEFKQVCLTFFIFTIVILIMLTPPRLARHFKPTQQVDLSDGYITNVSVNGKYITQVLDSGHPEMSEQVTILQDGKLITYQVNGFGRFSGAIQTKTSEQIISLWQKTYL